MLRTLTVVGAPQLLLGLASWFVLTGGQVSPAEDDQASPLETGQAGRHPVQQQIGVEVQHDDECPGAQRRPTLGVFDHRRRGGDDGGFVIGEGIQEHLGLEPVQSLDAVGRSDTRLASTTP